MDPNLNQNTQAPSETKAIPNPSSSDNAKRGKKKILIGLSLFVVVFILLIVSAVSSEILGLNKQVYRIPTLPTATPTPDPTANWKTFTDDVNNLTIKYPADWTILPVGGTKIAEQSLQEYVTETENALAKPGLPPLIIIPPDNDSKRKPVLQHEMIVKETKNKFLGINVLVAYILKDTITVVTIQAFPSNRSSKDNFFSTEDKNIFNQILSTLKFTQLNDLSCDNKKSYTNLNEALITPEEVCILDLSDKKLSELPIDILKFKNLKVIYLNNNKLATFPLILAQLKKIALIDLTGNPLKEDWNEKNKIGEILPNTRIMFLKPMNLPQ